jgi:DnaA family protein
MQQLPLNIKLDQEVSLDDYLVGKNQVLVEYLRQLGASSSGELIYLWGAQGSGKSHLLQATINQADIGSAMYLPLAEPGLEPEMLVGMEQFHWLVMDDVDAVVGRPSWEEALFHLYNRIKDQQGNLIVTAQRPPADLPISLPDLRSRFMAMIVFKIQPLSDNDKQVLLQQKAAAKGLSLADEVAHFMLSRSSRDLRNLMDSLDKLDKASLIEQRRITVPFVKNVLGL